MQLTDLSPLSPRFRLNQILDILDVAELCGFWRSTFVSMNLLSWQLYDNQSWNAPV